MPFVDVIARKRDGHALSREAIDGFVAGVSDGSIPDYQASALLMAIVLRGMTSEETAWLTDAMTRSGDRIDLSDVPGTKVGKHSTGGVGDKISIVLGPLAAACGVIVPKMSGRGLGHTGGTLDKLESIPGFRTDVPIDAFKRQLREVGVAIIGQSAALVPADKRLYALRDVTATVESIPLISASIMSKKLAEGSDALLLDVKCGDGAFMADVAQARTLAQAMVDIGTRAGLRTEAFVTDMDAPLGRAVGNALEVVECIDTLKGQGPVALTRLATRFAARMLVVAGVAPDEPAAAARVAAALAGGDAVDTLGRMIEAQGGDRRVVEDDARLSVMSTVAPATAARDGFVTRVRARAIGRASHVLGAGRARLGDAVDHAVGVVVLVGRGERVRRGQPLVDVYHRDGRGLEPALALCADAITIEDAPPEDRPSILGEIR